MAKARLHKGVKGLEKRKINARFCNVAEAEGLVTRYLEQGNIEYLSVKKVLQARSTNKTD